MEDNSKKISSNKPKEISKQMIRKCFIIYKFKKCEIIHIMEHIEYSN